MHGGKPMIEFVITVVVESDDDSFHAYCPALKGLHTCGATEEEALRNAADAAVAYLRSLIKHGEPIPVGVIIEEKPPKRVGRRTEELTVACPI